MQSKYLDVKDLSNGSKFDLTLHYQSQAFLLLDFANLRQKQTLLTFKQGLFFHYFFVVKLHVSDFQI